MGRLNATLFSSSRITLISNHDSDMASLDHLFKNNQRWAEQWDDSDPKFLSNLSKGQSPDYLWIGCSDSRVPESDLLNLKPGEIFVHRNIANLVNPVDLSSQSVIKYAIAALKVKHVIVCGHYDCGGVKAAMDDKPNPLIEDWLGELRETYQQFKEQLDRVQSLEEKTDLFCEINVIQQVNNVCGLPVVKDAWEAGQDLSVHGWIFDIRQGLIKDLEVSVSPNN